jgi:hypothetical protein
MYEVMQLLLLVVVVMLFLGSTCKKTQVLVLF